MFIVQDLCYWQPIGGRHHQHHFSASSKLLQRSHSSAAAAAATHASVSQPERLSPPLACRRVAHLVRFTRAIVVRNCTEIAELVWPTRSVRVLLVVR
jgi:hypothetical protein